MHELIMNQTLEARVYCSELFLKIILWRHSLLLRLSGIGYFIMKQYSSILEKVFWHKNKRQLIVYVWWVVYTEHVK